MTDPSVTDSILNSTKKVLGVDLTYDVFDVDIVSFINSTFVTLNGLGVGPDGGYMILDTSATWDDFLGAGNPKLNNIKTYVYVCVKSYFDPASTRYTIDALEKQKAELEWRISVAREDISWTDPLPPRPPVLRPLECF